MLQDAGLRDEERAATNSIQRNATIDRFESPFWSFAWIEGILRFVGFDVTTAYGLHPERALIIIVVLGLVLTYVYMWPLYIWLIYMWTDPLRLSEYVERASGIYEVFPTDRIEGAPAEPTLQNEAKVIRVEAENGWDALRKAAYFSLLSAVNIGFEQFTPGDWIRRLQGCEYSLQSVGWVRRSLVLKRCSASTCSRCGR